MFKKISVVLITFSLTTLFAASSVLAADYGGLGIFPANPDSQNPLTESWFIYNLVPGEEKTDTALIRNTSDKPLSAKIYAVDGTTTADGSFTLEGEKIEKKGLGGWVSLPVETVSVGPGEEKKIDFTVKIPRDVPAGDYTGGIILEDLNVQKGKGINMVTRVGVRMYETVPGQLIRKLKITDFSWKLVNDKVVFYFGLENQGNTQLNPAGKLYFRNSILPGQGDFDLSLGTVLSGKPTKVPVTWVKTPLFGQIKAKAVVNYGQGANEKLEREISFMYITNKAKIIFVVVVILLLFLIIVLPSLRRRKK